MDTINTVSEIVKSFEFRKADYRGAEDQLSSFANSYTKLSAEDADILRNMFDAKDRLGYFQISTSLFRHEFDDADIIRKDKLCKIVFASYSFDNMGYGYDSVLYLNSISDQLKANPDQTKKNWKIFKTLTGDEKAKKILENSLSLT